MPVDGSARVTAPCAARTDSRHVEAVEEGLDGFVDLGGAALALELENPLGDGGDDGVVTTLDVGQQLGKALVVVVHLWRPLDRAIRISVVAMPVSSRLHGLGRTGVRRTCAVL